MFHKHKLIKKTMTHFEHLFLDSENRTKDCDGWMAPALNKSLNDSINMCESSYLQSFTQIPNRIGYVSL